MWLNQRKMAELFGSYVQAISKHLKDILESAELVAESVVSEMERTDHRRRLPGQLKVRGPVPDLGNFDPARFHHQGLCARLRSWTTPAERPHK